MRPHRRGAHARARANVRNRSPTFEKGCIHARVHIRTRTHHVCTYEFEIKRLDAYVCTRAIDNFRAGRRITEPRQIGFARARASYLETVKLHKARRIEL